MTIKEKYLDYNNGSGELPEGAFRISASQFSKFMDYPHQWFREHVLGEEGFQGNTASVLGTIIHGIAAAVSNGEQITREDIEPYLLEQRSNPDVDIAEIRSQYPAMAERLVNDYIIPNRPNLEEAEPFVFDELYDGVFPSGSIDRVEKVGDGTFRIVDFKTYNSKTKPKSIPMNYKYQLLIYAYIYGNVSQIRLVYLNRNIDGGVSEKTGKPLKSYPPEVTVLTETITQDDIDFIISVLRLCAETYLTYKENPSLAYLLYRDFRLKEN